MNCLSNLEGEIWKDIPSYTGLYEASSLGRIRSKEGKVTSSARFGRRVWKQRIMKQKLIHGSARDDAAVCLWKDGVPRYHLVSRLVASTFHGDMLFTKMTVNHIDGNPLNNSADNLEWLTLEDNITYGFENGQFNSFMKHISAVSQSGDIITSRSYAEMDRKLGRYKGYTSRTILSGKEDLESSMGVVYKVKSET